MKLKRIAGISLISMIVLSAASCGAKLKGSDTTKESSIAIASSSSLESSSAKSSSTISSKEATSQASSSAASSSAAASSAAASSVASSSKASSTAQASSSVVSSTLISSSASSSAAPIIEESTIADLDSYVTSFMTSTTSYKPSWNQEGFKDRWNYIDGVFLTSIMNLYKSTNESKYLDFVKTFVNYYIDSDGNFVKPSGSDDSGYNSGELDSVCESRILFDLYKYTGDSRYQTAIETTYTELNKVTVTTNGYNYSHKNSYVNQIWLDGMYMYVPFLIQYANYKNDSTLKANIYNHLYNSYKYIRDNMFDENKKLYYHGHDTTKSIFWANTETGNSASFWLRSNGWLLVSMADCLDYLEDSDLKTLLTSMLEEALNGILDYQDSETKMFYQLVDQGNKTFTVPKSYLKKLGNTAYKVDGSYVDADIANYLESSGSAMISYACAKASIHLNDSSYKDKAIDIFNGIYSNKFSNNSLSDICITAGLGPESNTTRDGSAYYYLAEPVGSDDAKGTGPFIMAYVALTK